MGTQQPEWCDNRSLPLGSYVPTDVIGVTDKGLVGGAGSTFMRMRKDAAAMGELAIDQDAERLVALMSIAANRPVAAAEVLPDVTAAAAHWRRGDKALANLRLVFAKLPKVVDQTSAYRVALAEQLLDNGWSPHGLLVALGLTASMTGVEKYNPYHVPAGNGRRSGEFNFRPGSITVAEVDNEDTFEERERRGEATSKEEIEHGHAIRQPTVLPITEMRPSAAFFETTFDQLSAAASVAAGEVGPGKGPVYGTAVHTEFKAQVQGLGRDDLHAEQSYLNGAPVKYGIPGSVRVDVAQPTKGNPDTIYDLKTGGAFLTSMRKQQLLTHVPKLDDGREVQIHEVRP